MLTKNYNNEIIEKIEKVLNQRHVYDARSEIHRVLLLEDHRFIGSYEFRKVGLLECVVERNLYRDMDTGSLVIVDIGEDYEKMDDSFYSPYYYICVYVVDQELGRYEYELYCEY